MAVNDIKLTIGCANWDDPEGAFWTYSSLRNNHFLLPNVELLCVDDMPEPQEELKRVCGLSKTRYVHKPKANGPAHAKNSVFEEARGEYVLLLDCHVLLNRNCLENIFNLIAKDRIKNNIISGPLLNEAGDLYATELVPKLRGDFFGIWHNDPLLANGTLIEKIVWGMGSAFILCKKQAWHDVGGFPKNFRGFGGEEGIISELFRHKGGEHICNMGLGWVHRFMRTKPLSYTCTVNDKMRNYLIGAYLTGYNVHQFVEYFKRKLPVEQSQVVLSEILEIYPDFFIKNSNPKSVEVLD